MQKICINEYEKEIKMVGQFNEMSERRVLVDAAKRGAAEAGYSLSKVPGRGLSNVWTFRKEGKTQVASIRTTRDRWIAFPPLEGGKKWKTLDDVELVVVAAVDSKEDPKNVEVYIFPASDVRQRFDAAYAAHVAENHAVPDNYGMWVNLDPDQRGIASSVGSGIVRHYKRVAEYSIEELVSASKVDRPFDAEDKLQELEEGEQRETRLNTIGEVMAWARERVAEIAGVRVEAVKLDLKLEY
jgi:hypothetical protein